MTSSIQRRASNGVAAAATPVPGLSPEEWDVLRNSVCKGFSDTEAKVFGFRCQAMGLSPLTGQITAFKQGGGVVPIVTIDGYRSIAASIDPGYVVEIEYLGADGWVDWIPEGDPASQARAKVWRTGADRPVIKAVSRSEFAGSGGPWRSMPNHMLAKVAESHALRMAYPQGLAGTYSSDEVSTAPAAVTTEIQPPVSAPAKKKLKASTAVPLVTEQQLQTIAKGMNAVLNDVGREAFLTQLCDAFSISGLNELPAEQFDAVMRMLGLPQRVELWNAGKDGSGQLILNEERIAELQQLDEVDQAELLDEE